MINRTEQDIIINYPYIKHTQDEKAFRMVMSRKSWFNTVMGEKYETKWDVDNIDKDSVFELPEKVREDLTMRLGNKAHLKVLN